MGHNSTDLAYRWVFVLFAVFILACGTTHLFGIWTLWQPVYALEGVTKAMTALISLVTAGLLWPLLPKALALPSPQQLAETNQRLRKEIEDHRQALLRLREEVVTRKCIETNLKKSEEKLRTILETALDGIVTINDEGLIEMLNPAAVQMFGYANAAELLGRKVDLLMPGPYREELDTYLANYFRTGEKKVIGKQRELMGQRQDASQFPIDLSVGDFQIGGMHCFTVIIRDITERKRMEKILHEQAYFRAKAQQVAHLGYWVYDVNKASFYYSNEIYRLFGLNKKGHIPNFKDFFSRTYPVDRFKLKRAIVVATKRERPCALDYRIRLSDGVIRWIHAEVEMIDSAGTTPLQFGLVQDITPYKEAAEKVQQSEKRYQTLLSLSPVGVFHADTNGRYTFVSTRWCEITGLKLEQAQGEGWLQGIHSEDREQLGQKWSNAVSKKRAFKTQCRLHRSDGDMIWVILQALKEEKTDGEIAGYVGAITDVTEQKQSEEQRLLQQTEMAHAQRLMTVGELAGAMAHELNQPLGALANYVEGATLRFQKDMAANPELEKVFAQIATLITRAAQVVRSIRQLVRKKDVETVSVDINRLIDETIVLLNAEAARKTTRITFLPTSNMPAIVGRPIQLQQLLLNVIMNGIEAMEALEADKKQLTIRTDLGEDHTVKIDVEDCGSGFSQQATEKLFNPLYTTKPNGIGLGLYICKTIVESHQGTIVAHRSPEGRT